MTKLTCHEHQITTIDYSNRLMENEGLHDLLSIFSIPFLIHHWLCQYLQQSRGLSRDESGLHVLDSHHGGDCHRRSQVSAAGRSMMNFCLSTIAITTAI